MSLFKYREDRIPTALFFSYFVLDLCVFFAAESIWVVLGWMILGILPKALICSFNHHHQHAPTFHNNLLNRLLEFVFGFQTGIVSHGWVLHHVLGHHANYLDQSKDESRWKRLDGRPMGEWEYAFSVAVTGYPRALNVGRRYPKFRRTFVLSLLLTLAVLAGLFYWNPVNAFILFLLPMAISLFITAWHTFYHHSGLETENRYEASFNILNRYYNRLTGNLGYHTAHHVRPGLHWSRLPEFHKTIADQIPNHLYRPAPPPFRWLEN